MPQRPTDPFWVEEIRVIGENHPGLGPGRMLPLLAKVAQEQGRKDLPSERTISRILKVHRSAAREERSGYGYVHWPSTFETNALPWEAAAVAMELALSLAAVGEREPTVRLARWAYRIRLASPSMPMSDVQLLAAFYSMAEMGRAPRRISEVFAQVTDSLMTYQPWLGGDNGRLFNHAAKGKGFGPYPFVMLQLSFLLLVGRIGSHFAGLDHSADRERAAEAVVAAVPRFGGVWALEGMQQFFTGMIRALGRGESPDPLYEALVKEMAVPLPGEHGEEGDDDGTA